MFEKRAHLILAILIIAMPILAGCFYYKLLLNDLGIMGTSPVAILKKSPAANQGETQKLQDALVEARVKLAVLNSLNTRDVFRDPSDKNKFVFITNNVGGGVNNAYVGVYDFSKDKDYNKNGAVNFSAGVTYTYVYNETLSADLLLHGIGMDGSKLVLWETGVDNSPGPCFNSWQAGNLTYIDVSATKPVRKPYVVPQEKKVEVQKEVAACEAGL